MKGGLRKPLVISENARGTAKVPPPSVYFWRL